MALVSNFIIGLNTTDQVMKKKKLLFWLVDGQNIGTEPIINKIVCSKINQIIGFGN